MNIAFVTASGALVSLLSTYFANPPADATPEKKAQYRRILFSLVVVGALLTTGGAYKVQVDHAAEEDAAALRLADEQTRTRQAEAREKILQDQLINLRIDLGADQIDVARNRCPAPSSVMPGGDRQQAFVVWRYVKPNAVDVWFTSPGGRYFEAAVGGHEISTRAAIALLPCIAELVALSKSTPKAPRIEETIVQQQTPSSSWPTTAIWIAGGVLVLAVLVSRRRT